MAFTDEFHDLLQHAARTGQAATAWKTDLAGFRSIRANAKFGEYHASLDPDEPFEFLGVRVEVNPSLLPNRVILRAGRNTVGAFTIGKPTKQERNMQNTIKPEGRKNDAAKLRLELVPPEAVTALGAILTYGAAKYEDRNWEKGIKYSRVYGALMRHLTAWWGGEHDDPETGMSHLWHAMACVSFLTSFEARGMDRTQGLDDRPTPDLANDSLDTYTAKAMAAIMKNADRDAVGPAAPPAENDGWWSGDIMDTMADIPNAKEIIEKEAAKNRNPEVPLDHPYPSAIGVKHVGEHVLIKYEVDSRGAFYRACENCGLLESGIRAEDGTIKPCKHNPPRDTHIGL